MQKESESCRARFVSRARVALYWLAPLLLYAVPTRWIFVGRPICLFRNLFDWECPGCGMTRALFSLLRFDFLGAWNYNHLVIIIAPLLAYLYIKQGIRFTRKQWVRG